MTLLNTVSKNKQIGYFMGKSTDLNQTTLHNSNASLSMIKVKL